jgi:hypothetical protein
LLASTFYALAGALIFHKMFVGENEAFQLHNKYALDKGFSVPKNYVE